MLFVFFLITLFLIFKLNDILGEEAENAPTKKNKIFGTDVKESLEEEPEIELVTPKTDGIETQLKNFSALDFLKKAETAFSMIFKAYANGDTATLKDLLTPRMYRAFSQAIKDRDARGELLEGILIRILSSKIIGHTESGDKLTIQVEFVTEQCNVLKSKSGEILEGDPNKIEKIKNIWDFCKYKENEDLRWYLSGIDENE